MAATAPQKPAALAPFTDTTAVAAMFALLVPTEPENVESAVHDEPLFVEYSNPKLVGPVPDARPMTPLSAIWEKLTVDAQNLKPDAGNAVFQYVVIAAVAAAL